MKLLNLITQLLGFDNQQGQLYSLLYHDHH